jgi:hypothetical protein
MFVVFYIVNLYILCMYDLFHFHCFYETLVDPWKVCIYVCMYVCVCVCVCVYTLKNNHFIISTKK